MTDERRYDEDEVARILEAATEAPSSARGEADRGRGLTLSEIQDIAGQVGIPGDRVARAAARLDAGEPAGRGGPLGVPVRVWRSVDLSRPLTDSEWERLVVRLRRTFGARGRVESVGSLREWRNGNLVVSVEPSESGHRLSLQTRKGDVAPLLSAGVAMMIMAAVLVVVSAISGDVNERAIVMLAFLGAAGVGVNLARLPFWSRTRARQMEEIAVTVAGWTALPPGDEEG